MMLQEERHTNKAISFNVNLQDQSKLGKTSPPPEIKKKLEQSAAEAAQGPSITLEQISEKLKRAEQKRKQNIINQISPQVEERRRRIRDMKKSSDRSKLEQMKGELERSLSNAKEKRLTEMETKQQKLRNHIQKVEEIRREQAVKRKESTENMKNELEQKHNLAYSKKQENLDSKIQTAVKLATRKDSIGHEHNTNPAEGAQQ